MPICRLRRSIPTSTPSSSKNWAGSVRTSSSSPPRTSLRCRFSRPLAACSPTSTPRDYPRARYYGGCEIVDLVESLAIQRAKDALRRRARQRAAALRFCRKPGGLLRHPAAGRHGAGHESGPRGPSHARAIGQLLRTRLQVLPLRSLARNRCHRLRRGAHHCARVQATVDRGGRERLSPHSRLRGVPGRIADEVGAELMADMAHIAGLVAGGAASLAGSPLRLGHHHHTQDPDRPARRRRLLSRSRTPPSSTRPSSPASREVPLEHVIAGKAVCFLLASQRRVQEEAAADGRRTLVALAETLLEGGLKLGLGWHRQPPHARRLHRHRDDRQAAPRNCSRRVGITANKNAVPYDERPPSVTSGLRLGTPAMTTRGFGPDEMREVGRIIVEVAHRGVRPTPILTRLLRRCRTLTSPSPFPTLSAMAASGASAT